MPLNQWAKLSVFLSGARAATFYTIIGNCHRVGIDATAHLTELFKREPAETNQTVHHSHPKPGPPIKPHCAKHRLKAQSPVCSPRPPSQARLLGAWFDAYNRVRFPFHQSSANS